MNMISGMLDVTVTKDVETGKTTFTDMTFKPIVTHYGAGYSDITIYPLSEYTTSWRLPMVYAQERRLLALHI